jgi:hypothetical protein
MRLPGGLEQLGLGHVVEGALPRKARADHERVEEAPVVRRDDQRSLHAGVLAADPREAEPREEERLQDQAGEDVQGPVDPVLAGEAVVLE